MLFDGNPGYPTLDRLWDLAEESQMTTFGTSAAFIASCMKAEVRAQGGAGAERPAGRGLDRFAAVAGGLSVGL